MKKSILLALIFVATGAQAITITNMSSKYKIQAWMDRNKSKLLTSVEPQDSSNHRGTRPHALYLTASDPKKGTMFPNDSYIYEVPSNMLQDADANILVDAGTFVFFVPGTSRIGAKLGKTK